MPARSTQGFRDVKGRIQVSNIEIVSQRIAGGSAWRGARHFTDVKDSIVHELGPGIVKAEPIIWRRNRQSMALNPNSLSA